MEIRLYIICILRDRAQRPLTHGFARRGPWQLSYPKSRLHVMNHNFLSWNGPANPAPSIPGGNEHAETLYRRQSWMLAQGPLPRLIYVSSHIHIYIRRRLKGYIYIYPIEYYPLSIYTCVTLRYSIISIAWFTPLSYIVIDILSRFEDSRVRDNYYCEISTQRDSHIVPRCT
jgi:hypothetical protein